MPAISVTLVSTTTFGTPTGNYDGSTLEFQSDKAKADGYYGYTDGLHTVAYYPTAFVGNIKMQGTLALTPTSTDWFDITGTTLGDDSTELNTATTFNFTGNFVWVRSSVTAFTAGTITKIQLNH